MTQKPDNPPAFPHIQWHPNGTGNQVCGITLRDYFAAAATDCDINAFRWKYAADGFSKELIRTRAAAKYAYADAMLKAREARHDD